MKPLNLIIAVFYSVITLYGQNYKEDFASVSEFYTTIGDLELDIEVKAYDRSEIVYSLDFNIKKTEDNQFLITSSIYEMLFNRHFSILVLYEEKEISYRKLRGDEYKEYLENAKYTDFESLLDSFLNKNNSSVNFLSNENNFLVYELEMNDVLIKKMYLHIDARTFAIRKAEYIYDLEISESVDKVIVNYGTNSNPNFGTNVFSESNYFSRNGREFILNPKFKGYYLTNNANDDL